MRKIHVLGLAMFAVFAFSVVAAASASAATFLLAEWLANGVAVAADLESETTGELLLEDKKTVAGAIAVKECSGILDGTVGANSADKITAVLTLTGTPVKELIETEAVTCKEETGSCPTPLAWAVNLPWETEVELMEEGVPNEIFFADLILPHTGATTIGWEVECMGIVPLVDTCTATEGVAKLTLSPGLLGEFSEAFTLLAGAKNAECSQQTSVESGVVEGSGELKLVGAETLSASSQGVGGTEEA